MQKAPVMKGSGLVPVEESKPDAEVHVFGRNLEERVVTETDEQSPSTSFKNLIEKADKEEDDIETIRKRKFDAITGEEDEDTMFQGEFKLFAWDLASSNWIEKGRGQLKLNDSIDIDEKKSRLIMRLSGTLRIILNVAIRKSFFRVIACTKTNIRFTDSQTVWAASGPNTQHLKELIEDRLANMVEESDESNLKRPKSDEDETSPSKKTKAELEEKEEDTSRSNASDTNDNSKEEAEKEKEATDKKESEEQNKTSQESDDVDEEKNEKSDQEIQEKSSEDAVKNESELESTSEPESKSKDDGDT